MTRTLRVALTTGEPAGIGPEVALRAAIAAGLPCDLIGDRSLLAGVCERLGLPWPLPAPLGVIHEPLAVPSRPGVPDARNAGYVLRLLDCAVQGCESGAWCAMATAPVHKGIINEAGVPFRGHTEYLAQATASPQVLMLLVGAGLRVALVTTHIALREVPAAVTGERIAECLQVLSDGLRLRFGIVHPAIGVLALNPHAGEGGHMGREELDVIEPAIDAARIRGIDATGPLPADTAFIEPAAAGFDAILAMYHDQGLAPFKRASFGGGVNVTLGLPIVRTSADHGTALAIAGMGHADHGSMLEALRLAARMGGMVDAEAGADAVADAVVDDGAA
jgi:4-hydroxythreonine-4-phosphate dehydrogenase